MRKLPAEVVEAMQSAVIQLRACNERRCMVKAKWLREATIKRLEDTLANHNKKEEK